VIGAHPAVHALRHETRFLVDPGGFEDLARALTVAYTPYHADDALRRLAWLLEERLTGRTMEEFRGWTLDEELGIERYQDAVSWLWRELTWFDLEVGVPARRVRDGRWDYAPGEEQHHRRVVGRYFPDRTQLVRILRTFTERLFGGAAEDAGKRTWVEKTPFNLLSIPFLWELFPESTVIVIARHPVDVAASHLDQSWAPSTITDVLNWLEPVYQRWLAARPSLLGDGRYVEVRLEDLADRWPTSRTELFERLGLPDAETTATLEPGRVHHRAGQLTAEQRREITGRLGWVMDALDYSRPAS
jgi:hypothetical protein